MWSKPRTSNANLAVSNQHVAKAIRAKFRRLHLQKISSVRSQLKLGAPESLEFAKDLRKGGKKAFRKKQRENEIKKNNAELAHKISMAGSRRHRSPSSPLFSSLSRRKALDRELNERNRVISRRLKEAHFHDYYMPPKKQSIEKHQDLSSKSSSFAVRSAWGKQLRSAIFRSLTRRDLRGLKKSYVVFESMNYHLNTRRIIHYTRH